MPSRIANAYYDWTRIQLSLLESGQVELNEILMPYMLFDDGQGQSRTLYQLMDQAAFDPRRALPGPKG